MRGRGTVARAVLVLFLLGVCGGTTQAVAHPLAPSRLTLREAAPGGPVVAEWKTPVRRATGRVLEPVYPSACDPAVRTAGELHATHRLERFTLACPASALVGETLRIDGVSKGGGAVLVDVSLPGLTARHVLLHGGNDSLPLAREVTAWSRFAGWIRLGLGHIAGGFDHWLFVGGLGLLLGWRRRTAIAITGFTIGHSATLAAVSLGGWAVPEKPVEIAIAATLLWLALDLERKARGAGPGSIEARPFLVTSAFGLLHGLGFAGAFGAIDLGEGPLVLPLLGFNLGVELGQALFLGALAGVLMLARWLFGARDEAGPVSGVPGAVLRHAVGGLAAFWLIERTLA